MRKLFALLVMLNVVTSLSAQTIQQQIETKAKAILPKVIEWRRNIHQNPELGNREFKTMELIAKNWGSM
jgi:metal-dependent amidase/aminoacylase/carboxypeptidase family protein